MKVWARCVYFTGICTYGYVACVSHTCVRRSVPYCSVNAWSRDSASMHMHAHPYVVRYTYVTVHTCVMSGIIAASLLLTKRPLYGQAYSNHAWSQGSHILSVAFSYNKATPICALALIAHLTPFIAKPLYIYVAISLCSCSSE